MQTTFCYSLSTKACGPVMIFKVVLASSNVAFVAFIVPSLKIPSFYE
jgi:hypothetical protein